MDFDAPALSVGFAIDTYDAEGNLKSIEALVAEFTQKSTGMFQRFEEKAGGAFSGIAGKVGIAMTNASGATERELLRAERATKRFEGSAERLVTQMNRQIEAFGKTRSELSQMRAEQSAAEAESRGMTELATRLREASSTLEMQALAERTRAEQVLISQLRERAQIEETIRANTGLGQTPAIQAGAGYSALAKKFAEDEARANQIAAENRELAERTRIEQVLISQLRERAQFEEAIRANTGFGQTPAIQAGAGYSALAKKFAEDEARANQIAAASAERLAREHQELADKVRGSHAAQEANARAAEEMRRATDPLYAATVRYNTELAESTRLYQLGATGPAEYARQQAVLKERLEAVTRAHNGLDAAGNRLDSTTQRTNHTMVQFGYQLNDVATMAALGAPPMQIFASQAGQFQQVIAGAEGGAKGFATQLLGLTKRWLPLAIAVGAGTLAIRAFTASVNEGANTDAFVASLGLTAKEMEKLGDTNVTTGDVMMGTWDLMAADLQENFGGAWADISSDTSDYLGEMGQETRAWTNLTIGLFTGGYNAIVATWGALPDAMNDVFTSAVNYGIAAINGLIAAAVNGTNGYIAQANSILPEFMQIAALDQPQIAYIENSHRGAAKRVGAVWREEMSAALATDYVGNFGNAIGDAAIARRNRRLAASAADIRGDRPDPRSSPDATGGAEDRAANAIAEHEALISNMYALAKAYGMSGAAALVAEAHMRAETEAIRERSDVAILLERELQKEIATRVLDAEKANAASRDQVRVQAEVNAMVGQGLIPQREAAQLVKDRLADLPLLAALEVATQRQNQQEIAAVNLALADQRALREQLRAQEARSKAQSAIAGADDQIALLQRELELVGLSADEKERELAAERAMQEARDFPAAEQQTYIARQQELVVLQQRLAEQQADFNQALGYTAELFDTLDRAALDAAAGMRDAFGSVGGAIGDALTILTGYHAAEQRLIDQRDARIREAGNSEAAILRENRLFAIRNASLQVGAFGDMAVAAKGFFNEGTAGYQALEAAEKAFRAVEFALSVRAIAQDAAETVSSIANSGARAAAGAVEAVVNAIKSLPFPLNLIAGAATVGAIASLGVSIAGQFGGGNRQRPETNEGRGTVFGDPEAQSQSITRSIEALRQVDLLTANYSRSMLQSLQSIDRQMAGFANVLVRAGNLDEGFAIGEGFKPDLLGKALGAGSAPLGALAGFAFGGPIGAVLGGLVGNLLGGVFKSLFGTRTNVVASGLFGGPQRLEDILAGGFNAQTFADVQKKKKFFGITTSTRYSTQYGNAPQELSDQFTLILRSFAEAVGAAAVPLGVSTDEVVNRLNGFVVDIGRIDTRNLSASEIQEKLSAVFGAAADRMALAAFPTIAEYQRAGEGAFETLARVASSVETVTGLFAQLGRSTRNLGIDVQLALVDQFESLEELTSVTQSYFETYYTAEEQAQAKLAQFSAFFDSMGITLPTTLAAFRDLVEAQDLTTAAGRETYATLLQVAPAFADLQAAMNGARSAADILAERQDLKRELLQLLGDTEAIRALDLAQLDETNRALQAQLWALEDAKEAADRAADLRDAWADVGDTIAEEIARIRGLAGADGGAGFATLQGRFNAANLAARGGDIEAAGQLPDLSRGLLAAAELAATSRQELDRVRAQTAAALQLTNSAIAARAANTGLEDAAVAEAAARAQAAAVDPVREPRAVEEAVEQLREEMMVQLENVTEAVATVASGTNRTARILDDITADSGGTAIRVQAA